MTMQPRFSVTRPGLVLAGLVCVTLAAEAADSTFVTDETRTELKVQEAGPRQDWVERRDSIRFGRYSFAVTQRLDPATGLPPPREKQVWGDTFVGIGGSKPAEYMSSNWSPWDFLSAAIRLEGDQKDLPNPTRAGLLEYLALRATSDTCIVGEAAWRDAAAGFLRARFVGWTGATRFGLALRYLPPAGRTVASVVYTLVCQPYDYSDRGHWERRRCVATPTQVTELSKEPIAFDPAQEARFVFFNRFAQNDAGTVMAVDRASAAAVAVRAEGSVVRVEITPCDAASEVAVVLGDWVDEAASLACRRFFGDHAAVARELAETALIRLPAPAPPDPAERAAVDSLLRACPVLDTRFGAGVRETRAAATSAAAAVAKADTPAAFCAWIHADRRRRELEQELRAAWVQEKQFRGGE